MPIIETRATGQAADMTPYFAGDKLFGEDLSRAEIDAWLESEKEGYAQLGAGNRSAYRYSYHALNDFHHFRHIRGRHFARALGIGSAYGDEFAPIADQIAEITILDPSDAFAGETLLYGKPCTRVKPGPSHELPFEAGSFDLITCFGVLHHIPKVTQTLRECHRVLAAGGMFLLREPIVSMGDWRQVRPGLTRNERGIPRNLFEQIVGGAGFTVVSKSLCNFRPVAVLSAKFGIAAYNSRRLVHADAVLSRLSGWNYTYHRLTRAEKLAPASLAFVLRKDNKQ